MNTENPVSRFSDEVVITITASNGMGKSCIAFLLAETLRQHGLSPTIEGNEDELPGRMAESWQKRIAHLVQHNRKIRIVTAFPKRLL